MTGGDHDGGARMLTPELRGQPQTVVAGHHHVDDGEVAGLRTQRRERLVGIGGGLRSQPERCRPSGHDVANRGFVVDDKDGSERGHRLVWERQDYPRGIL